MILPCILDHIPAQWYCQYLHDSLILSLPCIALYCVQVVTLVCKMGRFFFRNLPRQTVLPSHLGIDKRHLRKENRWCLKMHASMVLKLSEINRAVYTRENKLLITKSTASHINGTKSSFVAYVSRERALWTSCGRINGSVRGLHKPRIV